MLKSYQDKDTKKWEYKSEERSVIYGKNKWSANLVN